MSRPSKIGSNIDRLSSLPDEIAHKIIEGVHSEDISRLSVVSKTWRQLCLSAPFFYVDAARVQNSFTKRAQLMNYVDRLLFLREAKQIPSFRIHWYKLNGEEHEYRIISWLHRALLCNPTQISLLFSNLVQGPGLTLPAAVLSCKSLETLEAHFLRGSGSLKIPTDSGFSSLKSLFLNSVRIDHSLFNWISRSCKRLENLKLASTQGTNNITITSPSLKVLVLYYPHRVVRLQVYAEKLQHIGLILLSNKTPDWTEPKLLIPNIQTIHKVLLNEANSYIDLHELRNKAFPGLIHPSRKMVYCLQNHSTRLRSLRMFGDSIQRIYDKGLLQIQFPNVSEIILEMTRHNVEIVLPMASFLAGTPNLQHLTIRGDDAADGNIETIRRFLDSKKFPIIFKSKDVKFVFPILPKLKDVKFLFPFGVQKSKLVLAKFLINSVRKIDVNVICTPPCDLNTQLKGFQNATVNVILQDSLSLHV